MSHEPYLRDVSLETLVQLYTEVKKDILIRGWIMDELERRDPAAFEEWIDVEYDENDPEGYEPRRYFIK